MRRAAKRDDAEPAIVEALKNGGAQVIQLSMPNVPDLLVYYRGAHALMEVKTGKRKLKPGQVDFAAWWQGPVFTVRNATDALAAMGMEPCEHGWWYNAPKQAIICRRCGVTRVTP